MNAKRIACWDTHTIDSLSWLLSVGKRQNKVSYTKTMNRSIQCVGRIGETRPETKDEMMENKNVKTKWEQRKLRQCVGRTSHTISFSIVGLQWMKKKFRCKNGYSQQRVAVWWVTASAKQPRKSGDNCLGAPWRGKLKSEFRHINDWRSNCIVPGFALSLLTLNFEDHHHLQFNVRINAFVVCGLWTLENVKPHIAPHTAYRTLGVVWVVSLSNSTW